MIYDSEERKILNLRIVPSSDPDFHEIRESQLMKLLHSGNFIYVDETPLRKELASIRNCREFMGRAIWLDKSFDYVIGYDSIGSLLLVPLRRRGIYG